MLNAKDLEVWVITPGLLPTDCDLKKVYLFIIQITF